MIHETLENLGLTNTEIKVYLSLLELDVATAGKIIEKSQLTTSSLHLAINSLIEKGLIHYIYEGKRRIYQATDPNNLVDFIEQKKQNILQILPELEKKKQQSNTKEVASLYKGIKGIKEVYTVLLNEKANELISFGDSPNVAEKMSYTWWSNFHLRRVEKGMKCKQIFDERHDKEKIKQTVELPLTDIRFLPKEYEQLQVTVIVGDLVAITVFGENSYALLVRDKTLSNAYKKNFMALWKIAKK